MISAVVLKMREDNITPEEEVGAGASLTSNSEIDDVDRPSSKASVSKFDIVCIAFSIVIHVIDVVVDLNLVVTYLLRREYHEFAWTMASIFVPSLICIIISLRMYNQDIEMDVDPEVRRKDQRRVTSRIIHNKACWLMALLWQMAILLRTIDSLNYALKTYKYKKQGDRTKQVSYYNKMLKEDQDIALLRIIECFIEAAPQLVLQLSILLKNYNETFNFLFFSQVLRILLSLISMGWAMTTYNRNIRLAQKDKSNITKVGLSLQFGWHFLITMSRIMSVSAAASVWPLYTGIFFCVHWFAMTIWILAENSAATEFVRDRSRAPHIPLTIRERIASVMFASVLGVVYIFTYLNPREGPTFCRYLFYHLLCFLENVVACTLWAIVATAEITARWYFELLICMCIAPFVMGAMCMIIYYEFHDKTKKEKPEVPQIDTEIES